MPAPRLPQTLSPCLPRPAYSNNNVPPPIQVACAPFAARARRSPPAPRAKIPQPKSPPCFWPAKTSPSGWGNRRPCQPNLLFVTTTYSAKIKVGALGALQLVLRTLERARGAGSKRNLPHTPFRTRETKLWRSRQGGEPTSRERMCIKFTGKCDQSQRPSTGKFENTEYVPPPSTTSPG